VLDWISLFFLAGGITVYVAGLWIGAMSNVRYVAIASVLTMLVLLLIVRLIDLTVYWLKNVRFAVISRGLDVDR
jgi:hypothetical protein